jgi:hypothetical protein
MTDIDKIQFTVGNGYLTSMPGTIVIQPPYICTKTAAPKIIDGKLDDWSELPIKCNAPEDYYGPDTNAWKGADDCRFAIGSAYDDKYLYLAVEVIDDKYDAVKEKLPWEQDGIEIRLDARPVDIRFANTGKGERKDFLLLGLSPGPTAGESWLYRDVKDLPEGTKFVCCRSARGFNTEVAIPLAYLNKQSGNNVTGFRLNVIVNDRDGEKMVRICWKPDWRSPQSYSGSGSFIMK